MKLESFKEVIEQGKDRYGSFTALRNCLVPTHIETVTYEALYDMIEARVNELSEHPAGCVGLYGTTSVEWIVDFFAAPIAGKRTVLLDPTFSRDVIQDRIDEYEIEQILPSNAGFRTCPIKEGDVEYGGYVLLFTSGTTASNKAVVLSQKALCYSAWNGQQMLACGPEDTIAAMLPLNHVFGLVCTLLWPLSFGASVGIGRGMRYYTEDPSVYQTTILVTVPTLLNYIYGTESLNPEIRTVLVGAAPCEQRVLKAITSLGVQVSFGYGLSETASGLAISVGSNDPFALELCPDTNLSIAEDGEVLITTPCMMEGYWHRQEETDQVLIDGVLHTGDLGFLDEQGCLHLQGRKNDVLVLYNGEKIYCPECEAELAKELGSEIALTLLYETLTLVVGEGAEEEMVRAVVDRYNLHQPISKKISTVRVVEGKLPRTQTGKLQRWKLEEIL